MIYKIRRIAGDFTWLIFAVGCSYGLLFTDASAIRILWVAIIGLVLGFLIG